MTAVTVKTDSTRYVHNRTGEVYLARHVGLMKIGNTGDRDAWVECVMYQNAERPSQWFARDLAAFSAGFTEEREIFIEHACNDSDVQRSELSEGILTNWSRGKWDNQPVLFGDITEHTKPALVGVDKHTGAVRHLDIERGFAICGNTLFTLEGDEVVLA